MIITKQHYPDFIGWNRAQSNMLHFHKEYQLDKGSNMPQILHDSGHNMTQLWHDNGNNMTQTWHDNGNNMTWQWKQHDINST